MTWLASNVVVASRWFTQCIDKGDVKRLIGHAMRYIMDLSLAIERMRTVPGEAVGLLRATLEMEVEPLHRAGLLTDDEYRYIKGILENAINLIESGKYDEAYFLLSGHRYNVARRVSAFTDP